MLSGVWWEDSRSIVLSVTHMPCGHCICGGLVILPAMHEMRPLPRLSQVELVEDVLMLVVVVVVFFTSLFEEI